MPQANGDRKYELARQQKLLFPMTRTLAFSVRLFAYRTFVVSTIQVVDATALYPTTWAGLGDRRRGPPTAKSDSILLRTEINRHEAARCRASFAAAEIACSQFPFGWSFHTSRSIGHDLTVARFSRSAKLTSWHRCGAAFRQQIQAIGRRLET
jgi:hypothetical protein